MLGAWQKFDVSAPQRDCNVSRQIAQTSRVFTWETANGRNSVKARLVAKGYQEPDLKEGSADAPGRNSLRPSHLQEISLCAIKKWTLWSLDAKNAFLRADGFTRDVFLVAL